MVADLIRWQCFYIMGEGIDQEALQEIKDIGRKNKEEYKSGWIYIPGGTKTISVPLKSKWDDIIQRIRNEVSREV